MIRSTLSIQPSTSPVPLLTILTLGITLGAAATGLGGCAGEGDVNRTQPDKVDKSMFFLKDGRTPKVFYYRQTDVEVPSTSSFAFEGYMGDITKVHFVINEKYLIGYRAYEYAPGSNNDFAGGANNQETPMVVFKIDSHFDVKREYNPATGEQTNVISENTNDRPWFERQYMRINWSQNLVEVEEPTEVDEAFQGLPAVKRTPIADYAQQGDIRDPHRPVITPSYFDITAREIRSIDYLACLNMYHDGVDDGDWWNCGAAEIRVRHSFMEVPESTYEPLEYPDRQPLLDNSGKPIRLVRGNYPCSEEILSASSGTYSGADCGEASVDQFAKFGFFRTVRQGYDRGTGATLQNRKYYANRWNMWQDTVRRTADGKPVLDANGQPVKLLYGERKTREIAYYTNPEFPDDPQLWETAKTVVGGWNQAMKETVASLILTEPDPQGMVMPQLVETKAATLPDIVVLKRNSCNLDGVKEHVAKYGDLEKLVKDVTGDDVENLTKANLLQVCAALTASTETLPADNAKRFTWQRNGDLRYSFFYWVDRPQVAGPLGYGPSSADPETGEIISAAAYNYGASLDRYAQTAAETVQLLNQSISIDDILSGKTITDVLADTAQQRRNREAQQLTTEAKTMATNLLRRGAATGAPGRLVQVPPGASDHKLDAIKGTSIEKQLMTTDILAMFPGYHPNLETQDPERFNRIMEAARPANWASQKARDARRQRFRSLASHGCIYLAEFADDSVIGLALELANLPREELFKRLRASIFRGLAEHEMGHTMGLRHNFAGSHDALNYKDDYWKIRTRMPESEWHKNKLREYQYSTVMDYGAKFNSDVHGLGKYDKAAIRFGYGQLVDVMPTATETGANLSYYNFIGDYRQIPDRVGGVDKIEENAIARYSTLTESIRQGYLDPNFQGGGFVTRERPYKFCSDEFVGNLECKPWDEGASQTEIINNTIDRFKNYYFFDAFKRDRLTWSIGGYYQRMAERYFSRFTEAFQFFYFFGDFLAGEYLADDLLKASVDSLNTLGEILQTPEPGMHCTTELSPDVLVLPSALGPNSCQNGSAMRIDLGEGKPYYVDFSDDYYYRFTRAGSLYEKLAALESLTSTQARFFRVDTFADSNQYSINYYRLFKNEMLNLLTGVIRNDPLAYGGHVVGGKFTPTPVVDLTTFGKVRFDPPVYMQPGSKRVDTPVNKTIRYWALMLTLGQLNSTWDSTLDISSHMNVSLKGALDDVTYDPATPIREYVHPQTGQVYRAPVLLDGGRNIGVELLDELAMLTGTKGVPGTITKKFGTYNEQPLPDWHTAKANLDAALASGDQARFNEAQLLYNNAEFLLNYRIDLLNDLREFRRVFAY
jgi:hypothetical protein